MVIFIPLYVIGCVLSYLLGRKMALDIDEKWTLGDRVFHLCISAFSWFTFVALGMGFLIMHGDKLIKINFDKEVKW